LIDFAHASTHNASLFFVSSVGTVNHLRPDDGTIPEAPHWNYLNSVNGYGASKHVAELLLEQEAAKTGLKAAVCRVGQISGPVAHDKGMWPKQEWLPSVCTNV
jgi:thioester reductase-like protein